MDDTPKVKKAWRRNRATVGLWDMAKTRSARHEQDGLVPLEWVEEKLPDTSERDEVLAVMLDVGLFVKLPAGERKRVKVSRVKKGKTVEYTIHYGPLDEDSFIVHDFLEFNESKVESEERRREDALRKTKERKKPGETSPDDDPVSDRSPNGRTPDSNRIPNGIHAVSTSPDPTRPDPTLTQSINSPPSPPRGARKRDIQKWREEFTAWVQAHPPDLLVEEWKPVHSQLVEAIEGTGEGQYDLFQLSSLHPHSVADGVWLLGGTSVGTKRLKELGARRGFRQTVGFEWEFIDCKCELATERAA
jgi:hypothetical protein